MKALFEFNASNGLITDSNGVTAYMLGALPFSEEAEVNQTSDIDDMIKLKNAGFTTEEIIAMKKAGIA